MRRGKEIAQGAHASMAFLSDLVTSGTSFADYPEPVRTWLEGPFTKVVVQVTDEKALTDLVGKAEDAGVLCSQIFDQGRTEFHGVSTLTAVAIGPDWSEKVDEITGDLKLY